MGEVGRSDRTPVKHWLLNHALGQVAGTLSTGRVPCRPPLWCVDLCGGDGHRPEDKSHDSSPWIMHKHALWLANQPRCAARLHVIEMMDATYETLWNNCHDKMMSGKPDSLEVALIKSDARQYTLPPWINDCAAFVHCDPNKVSDMPLTDRMIESWNKWTTYLVTLGCNVAGLKRLRRELREPWFDYVNSLTSKLPKHHDAILYWLVQDASQWAYLLSVPKAWAGYYAADVPTKMAKMWPKGIGAASFRSERKKFDAKLRDLFLTKEENNED